jgi:hypothetical protein
MGGFAHTALDASVISFVRCVRLSLKKKVPRVSESSLTANQSGVSTFEALQDNSIAAFAAEGNHPTAKL